MFNKRFMDTFLLAVAGWAVVATSEAHDPNREVALVSDSRTFTVASTCPNGMDTEGEAEVYRNYTPLDYVLIQSRSDFDLPSSRARAMQQGVEAPFTMTENGRSCSTPYFKDLSVIESIIFTCKNEDDPDSTCTVTFTPKKVDE